MPKVYTAIELTETERELKHGKGIKIIRTDLHQKTRTEKEEEEERTVFLIVWRSTRRRRLPIQFPSPSKSTYRTTHTFPFFSSHKQAINQILPLTTFNPPSINMNPRPDCRQPRRRHGVDHLPIC